MFINKLLLKKLFFRYGVQVVRKPHRGLDVCQDILGYLPFLDVRVVFDIGANIGQSLEHYRAWFPEAVVYCFEPSPSAFKQLDLAYSGHPNVKTFQVAMGSEEGVASIAENAELSVMSRLSSEKSLAKGDAESEGVRVDAVDAFCQREGISHINYLKTDTEGFELEVLSGASEMLKRDGIDIVEVEVGMYSGNEWHVSFEAVKRMMESYNYFVFGIYDQVHEWTLSQNHLRRVNVAFISGSIAKR